jgi:hypothetical protein
MESSVFKIEGVSSNKYTINDIPIAAGVPTNGSLLTYDSTKNQWVITPHEYIHVAQDFSETFTTTGKFPISYNTIIKDKTQTNIKYNITDSTWTLQPGTYRFSVYCPSVYTEVLLPGSSDSYASVYVSYTSIATGVQTNLKTDGAMWRENNVRIPGSFTYSSLNSLTTLIVTEPVIAHITFDVEIDPAASSYISIGNALTATAYPSVLVEQIE